MMIPVGDLELSQFQLVVGGGENGVGTGGGGTMFTFVSSSVGNFPVGLEVGRGENGAGTGGGDTMFTSVSSSSGGR